VVVARNHQNDKVWLEYFQKIKTQCPWSLRAYLQGQIDFQNWPPQGPIPSLGHYQARIWLCDLTTADLERLCDQLDSQDLEDEWLFSYPSYGQFAAPYTCLIQQNRQRLQDLRLKLGEFTGNQ
jgi:hypothetical protein